MVGELVHYTGFEDHYHRQLEVQEVAVASFQNLLCLTAPPQQ